MLAIEEFSEDTPGAVHRSLELFSHILATHGGETAKVDHAGETWSTWGVVVDKRLRALGARPTESNRRNGMPDHTSLPRQT